MRVVIEETNKRNEEVAEDVDVTDCLDELGGLYLRKLVLLLKQEFNFSLESTPSPTRQGNILLHEQRSHLGQLRNRPRQ